MVHPDDVRGFRYKEVCVCRIGLMHVYYSMYFHYLLLFNISELLLDKLGNLLLYLSPNIMFYISAELLHVSQTIGV